MTETTKAEPFEVDAQALAEAITDDARAEQGDDVEVQGFVTAALYVRPDGTSGLVIRSTTMSASLTGDLFDTASRLVRGQVAEAEESMIATRTYASSEPTYEPAPPLQD